MAGLAIALQNCAVFEFPIRIRTRNHRCRFSNSQCAVGFGKGVVGGRKAGDIGRDNVTAGSGGRFGGTNISDRSGDNSAGVVVEEPGHGTREVGECFTVADFFLGFSSDSDGCFVDGEFAILCGEVVVRGGKARYIWGNIVVAGVGGIGCHERDCSRNHCACFVIHEAGDGAGVTTGVRRAGVGC